jgi:hypothetical protein
MSVGQGSAFAAVNVPPFRRRLFPVLLLNGQIESIIIEICLVNRGVVEEFLGCINV